MSMNKSTNNRDVWLAQIEQRVRAKVEDERMGNERFEGNWSEFVKNVAWWLHNEKSVDIEDTIDAAAGLIKYRIKKEEDLVEVAGSPPNNEAFNRKLEAKGVPPIVCDMLFNKYFPPPPPPSSSSSKMVS